MGKLFRFLVSAVLMVLCVWAGMRLADREMLHNGVIRLHVVANSDSQEDQRQKLMVRDVLLQEIASLGSISSAAEAKVALQENLSALEEAANLVLSQSGSQDSVNITLKKEAFSTRDYDTFSLPAGVYESLSVTIGQGEGENWWCVVFPGLCLGAEQADVRDKAAGAGFSDSLGNAITGQPGYRLDFFFLDLLGKFENMFYG